MAVTASEVQQAESEVAHSLGSRWLPKTDQRWGLDDVTAGEGLPNGSRRGAPLASEQEFGGPSGNHSPTTTRLPHPCPFFFAVERGRRGL